MGSIGGLSSSTSSSLSSIRGYGGLASGLDRDTLIEGMTSGTTSKIQQQYQKKQKLQWKQTAIQGISSKLVEFARKYSSYTSSTNLSGSSFFNKSLITALGANSGKISVSGSSSISDSVSITGVKQLARNATMSSKNPVSNQALATGKLDTTTKEAVSNLENESLIFKYGNKTVGLYLPSGTVDGYTYDYSDVDKSIASINKAMEGTVASGDKNLSDVMEAFNDGGKVSFRSKGDAATDGNSIKLTSGSEKALEALGLEVGRDGKPINENGMVIDKTQKLWTDMLLHERLSEKEITFNYNGTAKKLSFMKMDATTTLEDVRADLQKQLDKEFGTGRIKVSLDGANAANTEGSFKFQTMDAATGNADGSSVLIMSGSDVGVLGKTGALKVDYGTSNRLNTSSSLLDSGLVRLPSGKNPNDPLDLKINGVDINPVGSDGTQKLTYNSSISDIISAINSADAGVKISYMQNADKFSIEATDAGVSGDIKLEGADAAVLFGRKDIGDGTGGDYTVTKGQDAIVTVKYAGSDDEIDLVRGSNSFNLDGLNITLNGTFGWTPTADGSGFDKVAGTEAVTFSAKVDVEKITTAVTDMIKDYNEMLELINKEVSTKPNRKFPPLTDDQKAELSESQIEKWEEEAKKGLLFNNVDIRSLADNMRFIFASGSAERNQMESYGITVSTDYSDNGKLVLDEEKFKAALESDPEGVKELFTRPKVDKNDQGGLMARITTLTDRYASTTGATKGILIEQAGSQYAPTTILNNRIQKELDTIDSYIERLQDKLKTETDRYIKQFTSLETLISQMNSQSSWLSQAGGTM